jgi:hypothetical protein
VLIPSIYSFADRSGWLTVVSNLFLIDLNNEKIEDDAERLLLSSCSIIFSKLSSACTIVTKEL